MNAVIPLVVSVVGLLVGAVVTIIGVGRAAHEVAQSPQQEPKPSTPEGSQVLVTVTADDAPRQPQGPHSEVVIYTAEGKAQHYAVAESAASVAMKLEEAAQHALQGEPTRIERAEAPRVS